MNMASLDEWLFASGLLVGLSLLTRPGIQRVLMPLGRRVRPWVTARLERTEEWNADEAELWLVEKRRDWADTAGDVESRFSKDELCTMLTIYWATCTAGSAGRFYFEYGRHPWRPSHGRTPVVEVPTGVAVFPEDSLIPSKAWTAGHYNLQRHTVMPRGGHFAPMEEPRLLVEDLRTFFRAFR